jgi:hypothetical protein
MPAVKAATRLVYDDGSVYTGEVNDSQIPHGRGKMEWNSGELNGMMYEGEYKDGLMHGFGILHYAKDNHWTFDRFEGNFVDDQFHGRGTYFYVEDNPGNMLSWENDFVQGSMIDCTAKIIWRHTGSTYIGQVKKNASNDLMEIGGMGLWIQKDGTKVKGAFGFNKETFKVELIQGTTPSDQEKWNRFTGASNQNVNPAPTPSQPKSSSGSNFWGSVGSFVGSLVGGLLGSSGGSQSSATTWQCIRGHSMTSYHNPGKCSWCGNAMWPK